MDVVTVLVVVFLINKSCSQMLSMSPTCFSNGESLMFTCETTNVNQGITFYLNGTSQGACIPTVPVQCASGIEQSVTTTTLTISFNDITHSGNWTCEYGLTKSTELIVTLNPCPSGGSSEPWWIAIIIVVIIIIIILVCCLCNTRCRFRYLLADCACTCPKKDTIVIRKELPERVRRSLGDNIEIQFLNGKDGTFIDLPCDNKFLKKPCMLFNPYIEIHDLETSQAGKYTMKKDDGAWQLELTVTEEESGNLSYQPRQNARKTLDPLVNGKDGNIADGPK